MDESKGKEQKEQSNYTLILHKARNKLGLTNNEYILCDTIHKLKNDAKFPGWCYATKETLGEILGVSAIAIYNLLKKLKAKGLIHIDPKSRYITTTNLWYETVETYECGLKKLSRETKES